MSAVRHLSDGCIDSPPSMSGFRLHALGVRPAAQVLSLPAPRQAAESQRQQRGQVVRDGFRAMPAREAEPHTPPPAAASVTAEDADFIAPYGWVGRLICMMTAAATGSALFFALM
jgi:hypothetical protein